METSYCVLEIFDSMENIENKAQHVIHNFQHFIHI